MKLLIADDDAVSRRLLEATLSRLGHDVVVACDGLQAKHALLAPDAPRLAILDWMMPGIDGLHVCRMVRRRAQAYVYIIVLTAQCRREDLVTCLGAEADDFLTKPVDIVELAARLHSGERILALQESLVAARDALHHAATHDRLTEIWNRGMILDHLDREIERHRRDRSPVAVLLADVDGFKLVNDTFGHAAGDAVLKKVASRLRGGLRTVDALGRYGGEEFLLVAPNCSTDDAMTLGERVRAAVERSDPTDAVPCPITVSIGVSGTDAGYEHASSLLVAADRALYGAKAAGRNCVEGAAAHGQTDSLAHAGVRR